MYTPMLCSVARKGGRGEEKKREEEKGKGEEKKGKFNFSYSVWHGNLEGNELNVFLLD